jgi:GMP synthase (glutamine-hydrolysing)
MLDKILIIDFGSQYTQLIARRVRELNVYCEIHPFNKSNEVALDSFIGVILSGSPCSVLDEEAPDVALEVFGNLPLLGVCYGAQLLAKKMGGKVAKSSHREYGRANLNQVKDVTDLLSQVNVGSTVWMSHGDTIVELPEVFEQIASTENIPVAAFKWKDRPVYGIQFHPEVTHSEQGKQLIENFIVKICGASQSWTSDLFAESTIAKLKEKIGNDKVVMGLSGGVDSSVAAVLIDKAIGENLYCIFVDNGLLRKNEFEEVLTS